MVGRAMVSSVLSTISTKNARQRARSGIAAARREAYVRVETSSAPARATAVADIVLPPAYRTAFYYRTPFDSEWNRVRFDRPVVVNEPHARPSDQRSTTLV